MGRLCEQAAQVREEFAAAQRAVALLMWGPAKAKTRCGGLAQSVRKVFINHTKLLWTSLM